MSARMDAVLAPGVTLLQASAGTGKTFQIADKLLRLVAEAGVPIGRIVVVTFTIAATAELRDRVRRRLRDARRGLLARAAGRPLGALDEVLAAWIPTAPPEAAARLERALVDFDEASIATLHGFCNRALARHAFESGASFGDELVGEVDGLLGELVVDFWTNLVHAAPRDLLPALVAGGVTRASLEDLAKKVVDPDRVVLPPGPTDAAIPDVRPWRRALGSARRAWLREGAAAVSLLTASDALLRRARGDQSSFPPGRTRDRALEMSAWCSGEPALIAPVSECVRYFTPAHIASATKDGCAPPAHPVFAALEAYADAHEAARPAMMAWVLALKRRLIEAVRREVPSRLRRRHARTYEQMLRLLRDALRDEARRGPLIEGLRGDHDVALIDEFQDTDPVQWEVFHTLFADRLCLIGDPKQAIYGFRGADIYTYRRAAELRDHEATLSKNFRSDPLLVEATNHLFGRPPEVRRPFGTDAIPFERVEPHHPGPRLLPAGRPPLELRFLPRDGARLRDSLLAFYFLRDRLPGVVADDVAAELSRAGTITTGAGCTRPVGPSDCAVLVRRHEEARRVQAALRERGIPSVLRADGSVFATDEARQLATILGAILEPTTGHLRVALTTRLLGRSGSEVAQLEVDEASWSAARARFRGWCERWTESGFAAMFRELLDAEGVAARLLSRGDARALTDLMHLGELLHEAAMRDRLGPVGLLAWLRRGGPGLEADAAAPRLESDADAVQVVTMHGCKGLEYPLVWCPYLWQSGFVHTNDELHLRFHDPSDDDTPKLDIGSPDKAAHRRIFEREQLEEDLRLLYVALTRARHRCTVYFGAGAHRSALAYVLLQQAKDPIDELAQKAFARLRNDRRMLEILEEIARHPGIALSRVDWRAPAGPGWRPPLDHPPIEARAVLRDAPPDRLWRRSSFSALVRGVSHADPSPHRDADPEVEVDVEEEEDLGAGEVPLHDLPGGTRVGLLFHRVLELHDFRDRAALAPLVTRELAARGFESSWEPRLTAAIQSALETPLRADGPRLADVGRSERLDELEFVLPVRGGFEADRGAFSVADLAEAFAHPDAPEGYADRLRGLAFLPVRGFLVGAIDLVFRHGGRYWLVDYKSNRLGPAWSDYAATALPREMARSSYTLQYHLYTLALHRYLGRRLRGYRYEEHFGGVHYLFLRGMAPERGPCHGVFSDRPTRALLERLDALLAGGTA